MDIVIIEEKSDQNYTGTNKTETKKNLKSSGTHSLESPKNP